MSPDYTVDRIAVGRRRELTAAQIEADRKRFEKSEFIVMGRFVREQIVTDGKDFYRITTHGRRYQEDSDMCEYGAVPSKGSKKGWIATNFLRDTIVRILRDGTQEPKNRIGDRKNRPSTMPVKTLAELRWMDREAGGMSPYLTLHGDCVRATRPVPGDLPDSAWIQDRRLVKKIKAAVLDAPEPYEIEIAHVERRPKGNVT